ncbi:hypothetical protein H6F75_02940 [Nodosilinea sp. FACHB-131]|uniref:SH3 domain-containing protein n=1 Tax=Cyanophyceae TaxID=3028117 RepID=UPI00168923F4|nr:SH3 domain-containing protein [Nodosilinea sp. FACHB-131]MBD1872428.1 hypothetical protein [Nodosilinea sp. FACHB-131]
MPSKMLRESAFGAIRKAIPAGIALLSAGSLSVAPALAQETRALTENPALIRGCRQLNRATEVFDNSTLGPIATRIGTLQAGTQVSLTGATSPGRAQVFLRSGTLSSAQPVGWINASVLTACGSTPIPATKACFRADREMVVRSSPTAGSSAVAGYNVGDTVIASANPPTQQTSTDGRRWMQVTIYNGSTGWIARTGTNGLGNNITPITCP